MLASGVRTLLFGGAGEHQVPPPRVGMTKLLLIPEMCFTLVRTQDVLALKLVSMTTALAVSTYAFKS